MSTRRRTIAFLTLALASGCTKSGDSIDGKTAESAGGGKIGLEVPAGTPDEAPRPRTSIPPDPALVAVAESMAEAEVSYPMELDALLDLVPAGAEQYLVVRDVDDLIAISEVVVGSLEPVLRRIVAKGQAPGPQADVERFLHEFAAFTAKLRDESHIDRGLVIGEVGGEVVLLLGGEGLRIPSRMFGAGDDSSVHCGPAPGAPGYSMCALAESTLTKYTPGGAASALRAKAARYIEEADIKRANILSQLGTRPDRTAALAIATPPGQIDVTLGLPDAIGRKAEILGSGPSPALGLIAPGSSFLWLTLNPAAIEAAGASAPLPVRGLLAKLTGEVFVGPLASKDAVVALIGVTDPALAQSAIASMRSEIDRIPKTLPDGTSIAVDARTLSIDGTNIEVLHGVITPPPSAGMEELFNSFGVVPELWLFCTGGYIGVVLGGGEELVKTIARHEGNGPSPTTVEAMPKALAQALVEHRASVAAHVSLDGLQSPQVAEGMAMMAKQLRGKDATADSSFEAMFRFLAPVSGLSLWVPEPQDGLELHLSVSYIGDPRTQEGKDALAAMADVAGGGDAAAAYGALATMYGSSAHVGSYRARAGELPGSSMTSLVLFTYAWPAVLGSAFLVSTQVSRAR